MHIIMLHIMSSPPANEGGCTARLQRVWPPPLLVDRMVPLLTPSGLEQPRHLLLENCVVLPIAHCAPFHKRATVGMGVMPTGTTSIARDAARAGPEKSHSAQKSRPRRWRTRHRGSPSTGTAESLLPSCSPHCSPLCWQYAAASGTCWLPFSRRPLRGLSVHGGLVLPPFR